MIHFRPYLAAKLSPFYARRVFPCFDEPKFKATFDVTIVHRKNYTALSNMLIKNAVFENSLVTTTFKTTPPMTTYLLNFILSDLDFVTNVHRNLTIYVPRKHLKHTDFVMEQSKKIIKELEIYTNISYNLEKLDLVGLPLSNSFTALECWGLIIFYGYNFCFNDIVKKLCIKHYLFNSKTDWAFSFTIKKMIQLSNHSKLGMEYFMK